MSPLRETIRSLIQQEMAAQTGGGSARIGTVIQVNDDNTAVIMVDGQGIQCDLMHPVVLGHQALVIKDDRGGYRACLTRPNPDTVPFARPPFFSGGGFRFAGLLVNNVYVQDAFDDTIYQLDLSDISMSPGDGPVSVALSPDGTRLAVIVQLFSTNQAVIRHYDIGTQLASSGVINAALQIDGLQATRISTVTRTSTFPVTNPGNPPYTVVGNGLGTLSLTDDTTHVYWAEFETRVQVIFTAPGDIRCLSHFMSCDSSGTVLEIAPPLVTSFYSLINLSLFNVGLNSVQPVGNLGTSGNQWVSGGGIWNPARTRWLALVSDPLNGYSGLAIETNLLTFPTGPRDSITNTSEGPGAFAVVAPTGASYQFHYNPGAFGGSPGDQLATVASGGLSIVLQSGGDILFYAIEDVNINGYPIGGGFTHGATGALLKAQVGATKSFIATSYFNEASYLVGNDFLNILYENKSTGICNEAKVSNSIAADSSLKFSISLLSSLASGWLVNAFGQVRSLSGDGVNYSVSAIGTEQKVTPGNPLQQQSPPIHQTDQTLPRIMVLFLSSGQRDILSTLLQVAVLQS